MVQTKNISYMAFANGLPCKILLIYLVLSPFFCQAVIGENFYEDKKSDSSRPFYMGSRYGRSGQPSTKVQVTPRTDRFFMGSRYGKRATGLDLGEVFAPYATNDLQEHEDLVQQQQQHDDLATMVERPMLKCVHLGIGNLYRCYSRDTERML